MPSSNTSPEPRRRRTVVHVPRRAGEPRPAAHHRERQALRSEQRFRWLADHGVDALFIHDTEGRFVDVNLRAPESLGYSREELLSMSVPEVDCGLSAVELSGIWTAMAPGLPVTVESLHRRKDGTTFPVEVHISRIDEEGRTLFLASAHDITLRRRSEERSEELRKLGQYLNAATTPRDAARVVLEVADRLIGWDACWLDLFDLDRRRVRAVLLMDTVNGRRTEVPSPTTDLPEDSLAWRSITEGPLLILKDEKEAWARAGHTLSFGDRGRPSLSVLCVPIRGSGGPFGALSIQSYRPNAFTEEDLLLLQSLADYAAVALRRCLMEAHRLDLEEQLLQARKMEAIGRLAGGVAHDFNNMLAVINGYSDLLLPQVSGSSDLRRGLEEIRRAGSRAADLTRQLLAFSRKQLLEPRVLDLNDSVRQAEQLLRRLIGEDIEFELRLAAKLPPVKTDPGQVGQVLLNLAVNARDAMPHGGRLTVTTTRRRVEAPRRTVCPEIPPGSYVELAISDTGHGMDAGTQARIFEPFYTTKEIGRGTGLGLATVYGIVRQSDGYITVESEPGRGATFRILFPCARPENLPEPVPEEPVREGSETVLLVEDEAMVRNLAGTVLTSHGYRVLAANDGEEAMRIAHAHPEPIDLLLTDVVMPRGINGRVLAEQFVLWQPGAAVLYMSGYTDDQILRRGVSSGSSAFLQKPFSPQDLVRAVRAVLDARTPQIRENV